MMGGYIAATSAFSVVNFHFLPSLIQWMWPTAIGVPIIIYWTAMYKKKFNKGSKVHDEVEVKIQPDSVE